MESRSLVWAAGSLRDADEPILTALDAGAIIGSGLFDTALVNNGIVVNRRAHVDRLIDSAYALGYGAPSHDTIDQAINDLVEAAHASSATKPLHRRGRLRLTWYRSPLATSGTFTATLSPAPPVPPNPQLHLSNFRVDETSPLANVKALGYAPYAHALRDAQAAGADEALLLNVAGNVCEGATSNVFVAFGNAIHTPPLSDGPLAGVTRAAAMRAAVGAGIEIREQPISFSQLNDADGLLLSSSLRGVQAATHLDGMPLRTSPLARAFVDACAHYAADA